MCTDYYSYESHYASVFAVNNFARSLVHFPLQRKGPDSIEGVSSAAQPNSSINLTADADSAVGSDSKFKKATASANSSCSTHLPVNVVTSAVSAQVIVATNAACGSGLSALLDYDDSDD